MFDHVRIAYLFFQLHRGVRQGWPLSGLLFVIGIELLARSLKSNNDIKGIAVGGREVKVIQFADDTTVFVKDHQSVINFFKLLTEFKHTFGLKINTSKTEAMWLGAWRNKTDTPYNYKNGFKNRFKLSALSFLTFLFLDLCNELGVPIAQEKTAGPSQILSFAGIELDCLAFEARLYQGKIQKCLSAIEHTLSRKKVTLKEIQSLIVLCYYTWPSFSAPRNQHYNWG